LIYPASNGYNSYFDKDEGSIGALKNPPKVSRELYVTALLLDALAIILGLLVSWQFTIMIFIYGLVSKAYSHPSVRLKRWPLTSWIIAGLFQGYFTFMACYMGINNYGLEVFSDLDIFYPAVLSSLLLWGSYPMTQIYQHDEDFKRGDITLSLKLGISGTFHFTGIFFAFSSLGFFYFFKTNFGNTTAFWFLAFMIPMVIYFSTWYFNVRKDEVKANFTNTMRLNLISSICFSLFFIWVTVENL
jgi:1,4-dihydroxy-2-naphthoate octaprenyltransferase